MNTKAVNSVDVFKFICAVLVIGIHTEPFSFNRWFDLGFGFLTRIAVPFFFLSSSFFLFNGNVNERRILRYCKRPFILYILYSLFYVIVETIIYRNTFRGELVKFMFGYGHLWYLYYSLIAVVIIYYIGIILNCEYLLFFLAAGVYVFGLLFFTYYPWIGGSEIAQRMRWFLSQNRISEISLIYSLPYMTVGYYLSKHNLMEMKTAICLGVFSLFALVMEGFLSVVILHTESTILWVSVIPLSACVFSLIMRIRIRTQNAVLYRRLSTGMYCIHPFFIRIANETGISKGMVLFGVVLILSVLYSYAIYRLSIARKNSVFSYLL